MECGERIFRKFDVDDITEPALRRKARELRDWLRQARQEGFRAVLIEREAEYAADIRRRFGLPAGAEEFPEDILEILGPLDDPEILELLG